jgi:hypothetical protein
VRAFVGYTFEIFVICRGVKKHVCSLVWVNLLCTL